MRGAILERFFNAAEDDKTWIANVKGLTEENLSRIITETNKWWQLLKEITSVLKTKQQSNTELLNLLKQFDEANTYFIQKVANNCLTKHIDLSKDGKET